ncbi:hypothetical protein CEXT_801901 [Caerostris extrusa]|uniref:Uncharacterized protein n=1 Tax=Caerostris extrusa TaxID=172846 RepID=A0AAV4WG14_CAEEX|nr:hypothetical protein CEXT_801901 [Caerostris extrusa]
MEKGRAKETRRIIEATNTTDKEKTSHFTKPEAAVDELLSSPVSCSYEDPFVLPPTLDFYSSLRLDDLTTHRPEAFSPADNVPNDKEMTDNPID